MTGDLDIPVLRAALDALVERHYALRARFVEAEGGWVQEVLDSRRLDVPLTDLTGLPGDARAARADRICAQVAHQPFGLVQGAIRYGPVSFA